jgi:glutathione S-transferase
VTEPLYHLALAEEWQRARETGEYRWSTRGREVGAVAYVHRAFEHQLAGVRDRWFADADQLVVLMVDPDRIEAEVRVEGGFPHLYGPLPVAAVVDYWPWPLE